MAAAPASAPAAAGLKIETDHAGASLPPDTSPDSVTMATDGMAPATSAADELPVFEPNLRVLVADDALMNRRLLRRAFTSYFGQGWSVTEATSAEEAVLLATETAFEVIVMDEIFAPGVEAMRGSAAIIDVRAHEVRTGVARRAVIVSCTGNAGSLTNLGESGADLVWGKPMPNFTNGDMQNELAPRLAESLARAQLHKGCY
jgi:CheY-like chemotaxis protein